MSLLSWERGLKFFVATINIILSLVAPLVGAWIEMYSLPSNSKCLMSLLSWERGLKSFVKVL